MDRYSRKGQWDVKRSVFAASVFYFFYYGGKACLFPFLTLYFRQMGLTASQTGLALGIKALLWFFVSPIWVTLAYRVNKTRTFLCYSIFIIIGSNLSLTLLPVADPGLPLQFCLNESNGVINPFAHDENLITSVITSTAANHEHASISSTSIIDHDTKIDSSTQATLSVATTVTTTTTLKSTTSTTKTGESPWSTSTSNTEESLMSTSTSSAMQVLTETPHITTSQMSLFQLAKHMLPAFEKSGITSGQVDLIANSIDTYDVTKNLESWKKKTLVRHITTLLAKDEQQQPPIGSEDSDWTPQGQGSNIGFDEGRQKREASNHTFPNGESIMNTLRNFTNQLSEKKEAAIKILTPRVTSNSYLFLCVLIILAAGEILSAPVELVSDNSLYCLLDELDNLNLYGKHRLSALVGAALCGITVSIIVYFSPCLINGSINRFHIHFYLFALLLGLSFVLAPFYPSYDSSSSSTRSRISGSSHQKCPSCSLMICSSCRHFLLLITVLIVGLSQAPMQNFMLWMIQDMEGSSELVYGSFVSANAISSMISSLVGRRIIKIMKPCSAAMMALLSIALQLILYAFIPNPWVILPLQLLNITGLSFLWTIVTHHTSTTMSSAYEGSDKINSVHVFARASQQRSLHATYVSVYQGLAYGFGSIISGFLYDYLHGDMTPVLIGGGIMVTSWGVIFVTYQCCCLPRKLRRKYSHLISDSESDMEMIENGKYIGKYSGMDGKYFKKDDTKKKKRKDNKKVHKYHTVIDTESSESDEHDWLKSSMRKESRML